MSLALRMPFTVRARSDKKPRGRSRGRRLWLAEEVAVAAELPRSATYRDSTADQETSMTSPDDPQRNAESPAETPAEAATPAEAPTVRQPPVAPPPPPQPPPALPAAAYPAPDPFAPIPRPPRTPWIAPQRKGAVIAISIVAALALLGAGVGIGAAAFGATDNHGPVRFERPGPYGGQGFPGFPNGPRHRTPAPRPTTPTPSPSPSTSG
jgi:hypothetical protein